MIRLDSRILVTAGALAAATLGPASAMTNDGIGEITRNLLTQGIAGPDREYLRQHIDANYRQHDPVAPDGLEGLLGYVDHLETLPDVSIDPRRLLVDGDLVAVHSLYRIPDPTVVIDLFRFENGKAVEHWDAMQPLVEETTSGRSMLDGPDTPTPDASSEDSRAIVTAFVEDVLIGGDAARLSDFIGATYAQHNPQIEDDLDGLGAFLGSLADQGISFSYKTLHRAVADGDFVIPQSEGEIGGEATAFYDIFRVEAGKIVEHWDVIQTIPAEMAHDNGMF